MNIMNPPQIHRIRHYPPEFGIIRGNVKLPRIIDRRHFFEHIPSELWHVIISWIGDEFPYMFYRDPDIRILFSPDWTEAIDLSRKIGSSFSPMQSLDWTRSAVQWMNVTIRNVDNTEELRAALITASHDQNTIICLGNGSFVGKFTVIGAVVVNGSASTHRSKPVLLAEFLFQFENKLIPPARGHRRGQRQESLKSIVMSGSASETENDQQIIHRSRIFGISNITTHGLLKIGENFPSHFNLCTYKSFFFTQKNKKRPSFSVQLDNCEVDL